MHSDLVKWIVKLLLLITEKAMETGGSGSEGEEEDSHEYIKQIQSAANLKSDYTVLAQSLMDFTAQLNK